MNRELWESLFCSWASLSNVVAGLLLIGVMSLVVRVLRGSRDRAQRAIEDNESNPDSGEVVAARKGIGRRGKMVHPVAWI